MNSYEYTDPYGETLSFYLDGLPGAPLLHIETDAPQIVIPLEGIDAYVQAMQELAETARRRANRAAREAQLYRPVNGSQEPVQDLGERR